MSDRVKGWLEELRLGQYAAAFKENAIDWELLPDVDQETLKEIGVKAAGHRLRILKAIASLQTEPELDTSVATEPHAVSPATPRGSGHDLAAWERQPGERKPVTMLFADIVESTALTERLDAEEAHELLYGATQRMCEAVERHRGTVCRFMGDGVMAMFGAPVASEHHAADACEAALAMQHALREYGQEIHGREKSAPSIRVGLNSGEVVVLTVGDGEKVEYDASGPTVPIAARMEQTAEPGNILLTSATRSMAGGRIEVRARPPVQVKGVTEPLPVFELHGMRSLEEAATDIAGTPFVGRRAELNQFRGILEACLEEGQGQIVYVRGEPGIGKTRLVGEFARIAAEFGASIHRGLVLPFGVGKGQDAIRSLVRKFLGVASGGGKEARQHAADSAIEERWLQPEQLVFLNDLLDLAQTTEQIALYDAMDNSARNAGKQAVVSALLLAACDAGPVLAIVEDIHWADEVMLALLAEVTKATAKCKALLVMTSRVDADPRARQWLVGIEGGPFATIDLRPLRRQDSVVLVEEFLGGMGPLAERCLERAAGNPFFLEQLLRTAKEGSRDELPGSIQSLVLARIDRLDLEDKRALQTASVIGQRFDADLLRHLLELDGYDCRVLVEHNLLRPEGTGYLFGHALIQEGVYGSLLTRQRRELHAKAAEWFAERDKRLWAQHLDKAEDKQASAAYLEAARDQARQYRYESALRLAERGLQLAPQHLEHQQLICFKAELLLESGHIEASMTAYREAETAAIAEKELLDAWLGISCCMRMTSDYHAALGLLEKCEPIATRYNLPLELSRLHHLWGNLYFSLGKREECLEEHKRALEYARQANSAEDEARALGGLGDAEFGRGRMISAYNALGSCVARCREHGFGRIEVANLSQMAASKLYADDAQSALDKALEAARAASSVGHERAEMLALFVATNAAYHLADPDRMETSVERSLVIARRLKSRGFELALSFLLGLMCHLRGEPDEGRRALGPAIEDESGATFLRPSVFGALSLVSPDNETRTAALQKGEALLAAGAMGSNYLNFYRCAIEACLTVSDWEGAERFAKALETFTRPEPLPMSDFFIARARALAAIGRGQHTPTTMVAQLKELQADAGRMSVRVAMPALDAALSSLRFRP